MSVVVVLGVVAAVLLQCTTAQTVHVVGDNIGWTIPQGGAQAYQTWAASKQFVVGDILSMIFYLFSHTFSFFFTFNFLSILFHHRYQLLRDIYSSNNINVFYLRRTFVLEPSPNFQPYTINLKKTTTECRSSNFISLIILYTFRDGTTLRLRRPFTPFTPSL